MRSLSRRQLGQLDYLGQGGFGEVFRVGQHPLGQAPVAYKEIRTDIDPATRGWSLTAIEDAVRFREGLSPPERAELDEYTVWPTAVVQDRGRTLGCLMPLFPSEYFLGPNRVEAKLSWLSAKQSVADANGVDLTSFADVGARLALVRQLVYIIGRLHKYGRVFGDISMANAIFALGPPRVLLMDCDGTASITNPDRHEFQGNTQNFELPEFEVPGGDRRQNFRTDVYKLGLAVIRSLTAGRGATQTRTPDHLTFLQPSAVDCLRAAVSAVPEDRPTVKELFLALEADHSIRVQVPQIEHVGLSRELVVRGQDVLVSWKVRGAASVLIHLPNQQTVRAQADVGMLSVRVDHAGQLMFEAENKHGSVRQPIGFVDVVELPPMRVDSFKLPRPETPMLPPVELPQILPLTPVPALPVVDQRVPAVQLQPLGAMRPDYELLTRNLGEAAVGPAATMSQMNTVAQTVSIHRLTESIEIAAMGFGRTADQLTRDFRDSADVSIRSYLDSQTSSQVT